MPKQQLNVFTIIILASILNVGLSAYSLTISPTPTALNIASSYKITLSNSPSALAIPAGAYIEVKFTSIYNGILPPTPPCTNATGTTLSCTGNGQILNITNAFVYASSGFSTFFIVTLTNPTKTGTISGVQATIKNGGATQFSVTASNYDITEGACTLTITPGSTIVSSYVMYTFKVIPTNQIPSGGGLQIQIPKWTTNGDSYIDTLQSLTSATTLPNPFTPTSTTPAISATDTITISGVINANVNNPTALSVNVNKLRTPITYAPVSFTVLTLDGSGLSIDKCSATVTMNAANVLTVPTPFINCLAAAKTVNSVDSCTLSFILTTPLEKQTDQNAINFIIIFPDEVDLTSLSDVQRLSPGSIKDLTFITSGQKVSISAAMDSYAPAGTQFDIEMNAIKHPGTTKPTGTFKFSTLASSNVIDTIQSGISYSADPGPLTFSYLTDTNQTGSTAVFKFTIQITDPIPSNSSIKITFPSEFTFADGTKLCTGTGAKINPNPTCSSVSKALTISSYATGPLTSADTIIISVQGVGLPITCAPTATNFIVETIDNGYTVDKDSSKGFTATPFLISSVTPLSLSPGAVVGGSSTYTLAFQNKNQIPAGGFFKLILPSDNKIGIFDLNALQSGAKITIAGNQQNANPVVNQAVSPITITISNTAGLIPVNTVISILIPGLQNPPSTGSTSSFTLFTQTFQNFDIDSVQNGWNLGAGQISPSDFQSVTISPASTATGASTTYTIQFTPKVTHTNTYQLKFTFDTNFLKSASVKCQITAPTSQAQITCNPDGSNTILVSLGTNVVALQAFSMLVTGMSNPVSAKDYSGFQAATMDSLGNLVHQRTTNISTTINAAVIIVTSSIIRTNTNVSSPTSITIGFKTINAYPNSASIEIQIPNEMSIQSVAGLTCGYTGFAAGSPSCIVKPSTTNIIVITGGQSYTAGMTLGFTFNSLINPPTQADTSSFQISVKDGSGNLIDQLLSGYVVQAPCDINCQTCSLTNRFQCYSCGSTFPKLDVTTSKCVTTCTGSTYDAGTTCQACDSSCLTCTGSGPNACSDCISTNVLKYLQGSTCKAGCNNGFYPDASNRCQTCTSPCVGCSSSQVCTSCIPNTFLDSTGKCVSNCISGYYNDPSGVCVKCRSNCLTCTQISTCATCDPSTFPILFEGDCKVQCPNGYYRSGNTCLPCEDPCATCSISAKQCDSCTSGLFLSLGQCVHCQSPCATCQNSQSQCSSCISKYLLQDTSCVTGCSGNYYLDSGSSTCRKCNSPCLACSAIDKCTSCDSSTGKPYLYAGSQCVAKCPTDAPLYYRGTCSDTNGTALPDDGLYNPYDGLYLSGLPFPFILSSVFMCILCFIAKMIHHVTIVPSNIVGFVGIIEWSCYVGYVLIVLQTHPTDSPTIDFLLGVAVIILNLALSILFYFKVVKKHVLVDKTFREWQSKSKKNKISSTLMRISTFITFKSFRILYSQFFGKDYYSAKFEEYEIFQKRLNIFSLTNFIICVIPICISAVITMSKTSQYKQCTYIGSEILFVSILTLGWTIYESLRHHDNSKKISPEDPEVTQSKMLFALEKSILEKLNESAADTRRSRMGDLKRPPSRFKRRNSLTLDSDVEYHEGEFERAPGSMHRDRSMAGSEKRVLDNLNSSTDEFVRTGARVNGEELSQIDPIHERAGEDDDDDLRGSMKKENRTPDNKNFYGTKNNDVLSPEFADGEDHLHAQQSAKNWGQSGTKGNPDTKNKANNGVSPPGKRNGEAGWDPVAVNRYGSDEEDDISQNGALAKSGNKNAPNENGSAKSQPNSGDKRGPDGAYNVPLTKMKSQGGKGDTSKRSNIKVLDNIQEEDGVEVRDSKELSSNRGKAGKSGTRPGVTSGPGKKLKNGEDQGNSSKESVDSRAEIEKISKEYRKKMGQPGAPGAIDFEAEAAIGQQGVGIPRPGTGDEEEIVLQDTTPKGTQKKGGKPKFDADGQRILYESTESMASDDERFGAINEDTPSNYNLLNQRFDDDVSRAQNQSAMSRKSTGQAGAPGSILGHNGSIHSHAGNNGSVMSGGYGGAHSSGGLGGGSSLNSLSSKQSKGLGASSSGFPTGNNNSPNKKKLPPLPKSPGKNPAGTVTSAGAGPGHQKNNFMTDDIQEESSQGYITIDGSKTQIKRSPEGARQTASKFIDLKATSLTKGFGVPGSSRDKPPIGAKSQMDVIVKRSAADFIRSRGELDSDSSSHMKNDRSRSVNTGSIQLPDLKAGRHKTPESRGRKKEFISPSPDRTMNKTDVNFGKSDGTGTESGEDKEFKDFERKKRKKKSVEKKKPIKTPVDFAKLNQLEEIYLQRLDHPGSHKKVSPHKKPGRNYEGSPNGARDDEGLELSDFENFESTVNYIKGSKEIIGDDGDGADIPSANHNDL